MSNPFAIKAPTISTVDKDGVLWTYDPTTLRWAASFDGKKINSKEYSTVHQKMHAHLEAAKVASKDAFAGTQMLPAPPQVAPTIEVDVLSISIDAYSKSPINFTQERFRVQPLVVKIEWDHGKGGPVIARYKEKDSGWKSFNSGSMILFHPSFMNADMRKFFERSIEGQMLSAAFDGAETQIAKTWWDSKKETRELYSISKNRFEKEPVNHYSHNSMKGSVVSSLWPITLPQNIGSEVFDEWTAQANGSLKNGDVGVELTVAEGSLAPVFRVRIKEYDCPVFSGPDLRAALIIGNATKEMLAATELHVVPTWSGRTKWVESPKQNSWPKMVAAQWSLAMPHHDNYRFAATPRTYIFGCFPGASKKSASNRNEFDPTDIGWHHVEQHCLGERSYRLAGPEDIVLENMSVLRKQFEELSVAHDLVGTPRASVSAMFSTTLVDIYNAALNGEDKLDKDTAAVKNAFNSFASTTQEKIQSRGVVLKWQETCDKAVKDVNHLLAPEGHQIQKSPNPR
jgi:hypothetical protein